MASLRFFMVHSCAAKKWMFAQAAGVGAIAVRAETSAIWNIAHKLTGGGGAEKNARSVAAAIATCISTAEITAAATCIAAATAAIAAAEISTAYVATAGRPTVIARGVA